MCGMHQANEKQQTKVGFESVLQATRGLLVPNFDLCWPPSTALYHHLMISCYLFPLSFCHCYTNGLNLESLEVLENALQLDFAVKTLGMVRYPICLLVVFLSVYWTLHSHVS